MLRIIVELVPGGVGRAREPARAELGNLRNSPTIATLDTQTGVEKGEHRGTPRVCSLGKGNRGSKLGYDK